MRISHIAMYVRDLEVVKEFYIRFFGAKAGELYHNPKTGLKSYMHLKIKKRYATLVSAKLEKLNTKSKIGRAHV